MTDSDLGMYSALAIFPSDHIRQAADGTIWIAHPGQKAAPWSPRFYKAQSLELVDRLGLHLSRNGETWTCAKGEHVAEGTDLELAVVRCASQIYLARHR